MTNEELLQKVHEQKCAVSYYNAAEGPSWYNEANARTECIAKLHDLYEECDRRGITPREGNYLC